MNGPDDNPPARPADGAATRSSADFHVPDTVSPEAQDGLASFSRHERDGMVVPEPDDLDGWKRAHRENEQLTDNGELLRHYRPEISQITLDGVSVLDIRPNGWRENGKLVIYLHGGSYTYGTADSSLISAVPLAAASGLRVLSVDYTTAPQARWPAITDQVLAVYGALLDQGKCALDIAFYGESAGAGLAAGTLLKARDKGMTMPSGALLWSPWADITETGDTYFTLKDAEPVFTYDALLRRCAAAYADPEDQRNPYVSPVYGDFSRGFPPTMIQVGTKEIFLSNAVRLYQALDMAGIPVRLDVYEGMPHVFQVLLPEIPESGVALKKSAAFLRASLKV